MSSFFALNPSDVNVTIGAENSFTFSLLYNSDEFDSEIRYPVSAQSSLPSAQVSRIQKLADKRVFYIFFSYGNEGTQIGRAEDIAQANIEVVEVSSGWQINRGRPSEKPCWVLHPTPQLDNTRGNENKVFSIRVSKLRVNNQEGTALLSIHPSWESSCQNDSCLRIHKMEGLSIQDMTLWRTTWTKNEKFSFTVNTCQETTFEFDGQIVRPQQENTVSYSTKHRTLIAQNLQTGFKEEQEFPLYALEVTGEKDSFLLKWEGSPAPAFDNYRLNEMKVEFSGQQKISVDSAAKFFSSTLSTTEGSSATATEFSYQLRNLPLPVIKSFDAKVLKNQLAPSDTGFMELYQLEQPGVSLQIAPYEPFPPAPKPEKKVKVSWDVVDADQIEIQGKLVTSNDGCQVLSLPADTKQVSIKVSLTNGFFREQQAFIEEES